MDNQVRISDSVSSFTVPLAKLQEEYPNKRLVAGVAIAANLSKKWDERRLLLIRRSASEHMLPLMYEIPGGKSEAEDESIVATAVRETKEETGLDVTGILQTFEGFEYDTRKGPAIQFNFLVEVKDGLEAQVQLNPSEHEEYAWIGVGDDLSLYPMTTNMSKVVTDALSLLRNIV